MIRQDVLDSVTYQPDILYKTVKGQRMLLDLYSPRVPPASPTPLLILLHGGGWFRQDKRHEVVGRFLNHIGTEVVNTDGWQIAGVEYRLRKDGAVHPDQLHDCADAVRFFMHHAATYNIDPRNILVAGSSSGGYATLMLAVAAQRYGEAPELAHITPEVTAAVSFSGMVDIPFCVTVGEERYAATGDGRLRYCMEALLTRERLHDEALQNAHDPKAFLHPGAAPTLLVYGTHDSLVPCEQAINLHRLARERGLDWEALEVRNAEHNFAPFTAEDPTSLRATDVYRAGRDFMKKHLRGRR